MLSRTYFLAAFLLLPQFSLAGIVVNISDNVPPQSGVGAQGEPVGLIVDLVRQAMKNVEFRIYPLARALEITRQEKNTLQFISRTPAREKDYIWIAPVYATRVYIYVNPGWVRENGDGLDTLGRIGVLNGSSLIQELDRRQYKGTIFRSQTNEQTLGMLLRNRVQGWMEGQITAEYIMNKVLGDHVALERIGPILNNVTWVATATASDPNWVKEVRERIEAFKDTKNYKSMLLRYGANPLE